MDASPLAQLNGRQGPFVLSPIEDQSPLWDISQQNPPQRLNPLQRGPFARAFSTSFTSSSSAKSNFTNSTSASSTGSGYFDLRESRAKGDLLSPMASLTADMSANFSLDPSASPRLPTPRRSLLPSLSFGSQFGGRQPLRPTTPDDHTTSSIDTNSSPHSPLPHKLPAGQPSVVVHSATALQDITNRANCPMRPPLSRFKASSFCSLSGKTVFSGLAQSNSSNSTPIFKKSSLYQFQVNNGQTGNEMDIDDKENVNSTEASLDELFAVASPPPSISVKKDPAIRALHTSSHSMDASPSSASEIDSPLCLSRFTSRHRPKPKVRRTLSMFQKPGDVIDTEMEETGCTASQLPCREFMKQEECQILPCFGVKEDMLKRINCQTLIDVLDGRYKHLYDEHLVIDCRFPYEYEGGHIAGAINVNTWDSLESFFLEIPRKSKTLVVFHCEYSAHRAPRLALHLRNRDRQLNMHQYPKLHYPEIYILQGGYSGFFACNKERCEPQNYVAMQDERHRATCAREMRNFGKNANRISRTQSFTYGINTSSSSISFMSSMSTTTTTAQPATDMQDDDDTMNTEDDTFDGIESRMTGINSGVRRAPSTSRSTFPTRRAVSY